MSSNELRRQSKQVKTLCAACQERKARFRYRGEVRADRDHTLCFECFRGEVNRARARRLVDAAVTRQVRSPFGPTQASAAWSSTRAKSPTASGCWSTSSD